jgi:hypothetical protein
MRRVKPAAVVMVAVALGAGAAVGCGDQKANDARLFLDRVERIDVEGPRESRRVAVDALANVAVETEEIQRARDLCVEAHRTLLDAEDTQANAQAELDRIIGNGINPNADIAPDVASRLDRQITEARQGIERSRQLMPRCQDEVGDLAREYARRR